MVEYKRYIQQFQSNNSNPTKPVTLSSDLGFKGLDGFEDNHGGTCVQKLFGNVDFKRGEQNIPSLNTLLPKDYFSSEPQEKAESCLVVNWERKGITESGNLEKKGTGGIRWVGSFKKGAKGFAMFLEAKPNDEDEDKQHYLSFRGEVYFIDKSTSSSNTGLAKTNNGFDSSDNTMSRMFPSTGNTFHSHITKAEGITSNDYWGFVSGDEDLKTMCPTKTVNCPSTEDKNAEFKKIWEGVEQDNPPENITSWSSNFDSWAETGFKMSTTVNLKNILESFKGHWKLADQ